MIDKFCFSFKVFKKYISSEFY